MNTEQDSWNALAGTSGTTVQQAMDKVASTGFGAIGALTNVPSLVIGSTTQTANTLFDVNSNNIRLRVAKTPASAADTGVAGQICWDANFVYVCTATNTWKRVAIATW